MRYRRRTYEVRAWKVTADGNPPDFVQEAIDSGGLILRDGTYFIKDGDAIPTASPGMWLTELDGNWQAWWDFNFEAAFEEVK